MLKLNFTLIILFNLLQYSTDSYHCACRHHLATQSLSPLAIVCELLDLMCARVCVCV